LAVLVDRGGRELPIAADFVGLDLRQDPTQQLEPGEQVQVQLTPSDEQDAIAVTRR
jgi:pyrimidine operon attenuation protein/uracil phosphoribosyltransferase